MNDLKLDDKRVWAVPVLVSILLIILATAFYPAYNPEPKNVPLAIVNEDAGAEVQGETLNIGETLTKELTRQDNDAVLFHIFESREKLDQWIDDNEDIPSLTIHEDFSKNSLSYGQNILIDAKQQEVQEMIESGEMTPAKMQEIEKELGAGGMPDVPEPAKAQITTRINVGEEPMLSQATTQIINSMTATINEQVSDQNINLLAENDVDIPSNMAIDIKNPVEVESVRLNEVQSNQANGNVGMVMFMPIWLGSLISSLALFSYIKSKRDSMDNIQRNKLAWMLPLLVILTSFSAGFGYVYYMSGVMNFNIPDPSVTALYVSLAVLGFISLLLGLMLLLGFIVIPLFMLFLFFTMQAVILPKAMIPEFYQNYIVPWNPFGFYMQNLKELIYLDAGLTMDTTMWMFIGFIIFGIIIFYIKLYMMNKPKAD